MSGASGYPRAERETCAVYEAETGKWHVYSCEPKHVRRLTRVFGPPAWTDDKGAARWNELPEKAVGFRKPRKKVIPCSTP